MVGDWIYYINHDCDDRIYKVHADSSEFNRELYRLNDHRTRMFDVVGDWIYYSTKSSIFKVRTDGSKPQKIIDDITWAIIADDDWIYYLKIDDDSRPYKVSTDGTERTKISDDKIFNFNVLDDWLYFISEENYIYKTRTDGSMLTKLNDEHSNHFNVINEWMFYTTMTGMLDEHKICIISTDGTKSNCLDEDGSWSLNKNYR